MLNQVRWWIHLQIDFMSLSSTKKIRWYKESDKVSNKEQSDKNELSISRSNILKI